MKNTIQRFGKFLSAMVMPNIGALIAFGFFAALFIDTGWLPNKELSQVVGPMLTYLIPILIASTGGYMVGGKSGQVVGAIAIMGAILTNLNITMLMAAMVMGPLGGWCIKKWEQFIEPKTPAGFEMLVRNFSIAIVGLLLSIAGFLVVGPVMATILSVLSVGVDFLITHTLLPLVSIFIEPAKVLFLNNAINHGIFTPLAGEQVAEAGKSIMYMLEANPGPGFGVLLACFFFSKNKITKQSTPGAMIIHLLGGIHEIYFPYILMNPLLIVAPIVGNMVSIFWYSIMHAGLTGPASPGSIIAFMAMSPNGEQWIVLVGVILGTVVSFLIASPIVRLAGGDKEVVSKNDVAQDQPAHTEINTKVSGKVQAIVFACDAGMGSSAMGATRFRNRLKEVAPEISVTNSSVDNIPGHADIVVVQHILRERAMSTCPNATVICINNFLSDPALDNLLKELVNSDTSDQISESLEQNTTHPTIKMTEILHKNAICLQQATTDKETAIRMAGKILLEAGCVEEAYLDAMQEREKLLSTYIGMGVAIPHGTNEAKEAVKKTGISVLQFPEGVPFGEEKAQLVIGIAGVGNEHLDLLAKLCTILEDPERLERLKTTSDVDWVYEQLTQEAK